MVFCDTGYHKILGTMWKMPQAWKKKNEEGGVTTLLRVFLWLCCTWLRKGGDCDPGGGESQCYQASVDAGGRNASGPCLEAWDPKKGKKCDIRAARIGSQRSADCPEHTEEKSVDDGIGVMMYFGYDNIRELRHGLRECARYSIACPISWKQGLTAYYQHGTCLEQSPCCRVWSVELLADYSQWTWIKL